LSGRLRFASAVVCFASLRSAENGVEVWAGRGFGGQLLYVIPARDTVAVVNAWNVFGTPARGIGAPLLEALTAER
jgi:hypothetical protein